MTEKDLDIAIEKCERIMEFDTRTLKNPESENGWIFEKVYDLLQYLRQFQFATDTNVGGNLIDRQAAIKAADSIINRDTSGNNDVVRAMTAWKEYIKALPSAQPECEDAVSRFEVLRLIDYSSNDLNDSVDNWYFQGKVKELPSVTPKQPGWIPCKTALPKEDGQYIVTVKYEHVDGYEDIYSEHGEWVDGHWDAGYGHCGSMEKVLAWQPLPKPWEEEKAEGAATP